MPAIPLTVYTRVPDPDSDAELGHLEEGDAATSAGRVSERSRLWPLGIAFALGVLLSSTVFVLLNIGVNTGNRLAGVSAAVEGEVKTQTFYRPAPSESPTPTSAVTTSIAQPGPNLDPLTFLMHFDSEPAMNEAPAIEPPECPLKIQYTADTSIAEAIVYNADFYSGPGDDSRKKQRAERPWQKLVIWGSESAPNRPSLERYFNSVRANGTSDMYDAAMSYRLNSSVPATYAYSYFNYSNPPVPYEQKRQDKIAASFVSNCHPKNIRNLILDSLREDLPGQIDSFGSCKNDAEAEDVLKKIGRWEEVGASTTRWNVKITTINYYKFSVAIENSNDIDYVTEKFYQPLERGSVPIVFGAPDFAARFFPAPNAAIDVADYLSSDSKALSTSKTEEPVVLSSEDRAGLRRLAERLQFLASPEGQEEYEGMLAWKKDTRWMENSPLGKIVKLEAGYPRHCRLGGVLRGLDWAKSGWTPP